MSVSQVVGAVAGVAVGYFTGNPQLGFATYAAVSGVGAYLSQPNQEGPRLDDLRVQMSSYGANIPFEWGVNRHAGTIIWPKVLELKESSHSQSAKGGPEATTYTYSCSVAVLLCEGPIKGVRRIWANKKLVYDISADNTDATKDPAVHGLRFYLGTETQQVDPLIEATDGPSPAYLGYAYVVFEDFDLTDYANRPPQFEFEIVTEGDDAEVPPVKFGEWINPLNQYSFALDPVNNRLWKLNGWTASTAAQTGATTDGSAINVYDLNALELLNIIPLGKGTSNQNRFGTLAYNPDRLSMFIGCREGDYPWVEISCESMTVLRTGDWNDNPFYPPFPGVVAYSSAGVMYSASDRVAAGNQRITAFNPDSHTIAAGNYSVAGKTMAITLPDHRVVFAGDGIQVFGDLGAGELLFIPGITAFGVYAPDSNVSYDSKRKRLLWAARRPIARIVDMDSDSPLYGQLGASLNFGDSFISAVAYDELRDVYYVAALDGSAPKIKEVDPDTLLVTNEVDVPITANGLFLSAQQRGLVIIDLTEAYFIRLGGTLAPQKIALSRIVGDLCRRAGLTDADIDVAQLTDLVDGYIVPRQMTARAAIEPLQQAYYFDAVESDDKLKFVKRGAAAPVLIPMESRAARDFGADLPDSLAVVRAQDMELPVQCDVEYPDVDADHLIGNQYDRRITKDTKQRINLQLPIVMGAEKAKQVAIVNLYAAWLNETYRFTTSRAFAHLEPTDLVDLPTNDATYTARLLTKREQPNGVIEWEAKKEGVSVYTQSGAGAAPTNYVSQSIFTPGTTVLELMDLPLLRDQDAGKGFPVAMAGTSASWPGAQLFKSSDAGSTYGALFSQSEAAVIGRATTVLGNFTGGDIFDDGNSVTVKIQPGGQLVSYSESQLLAGTSAFALGVNGRWEIVQYKTATLTALLTYTLTGLLRGRKGTEWAAGTHQAGDHFVMLNTGGIQFYDPGPADANIERLYKAPAFRAALSSAPAVTFTDTRLRLRPYSVANLRVDPAADGYLITWAHRSIVGGGWLDGADAPRDPAFVAFDATFSKDDGTVVKTYSVTDEFIAYTSAQAALDFGQLPASFQVRVAQRNSDYGQGIGVTVSSTGSAFSYDVPGPSQTPSTPGTPSGNPSLISVKSLRMSVQDGSPYSASTANTAPYYVRSSLIYYAPGHGLAVGDYVWRQNMPELIFRQGYGSIGPFQDTGSAPPPANSPDYTNFLIFNKVREVTADTFTLYDLDSFTFTSEASNYLNFSGTQTIFAAGTVQRVLVSQVPAIIDDPFLVPLPSAYVRPLSPFCPKLWDGAKFIAEAYGPADIPGNENQRLMISAAGSSGWTTSPASGLGHGRMAYHGGLYVGWNGWFRVSADNLATWQAKPMFNFPLHNTQGNIQFDRVLYLNGEFVALGERGYIITSQSGLDWTEVSDGTTPLSLRFQAMCGAAFDGTHYIVVGYNPGNYSKPVIYRGTSLGALEEVAVPHIGPEFGGGWGTLNEVKYESGRFIAIGSKLHIYSPLADLGRVNQPFIVTSTDGGATWTDVSFTGSLVVLGGDKMNSGLVELVKVGSAWLATGQNCSATSPDGATWTERPHPLENRLYTVSNGSLAITNINNGGTSVDNNMVWSTTDAINWTQVTV